MTRKVRITQAGQERAEAQARVILSDHRIRSKTIQYLIDRFNSGTFVGDDPTKCWFGCLGVGMRMGYNSTREMFGISSRVDASEVPIEDFVYGVRFGDTPHTSPVLALLVSWCNDELNRRKAILSRVHGSVDVSVTDEMLDRRAVDTLIRETSVHVIDPSLSHEHAEV